MRTDGRERRVLELLHERDRRVTVGELADSLSRDGDTADAHDAVHEDLFERVLPSLDEADRVRFDESKGVVSLSRDRRLVRLVSTARRWWGPLGVLVLVVGASLAVLL